MVIGGLSTLAYLGYNYIIETNMTQSVENDSYKRVLQTESTGSLPSSSSATQTGRDQSAELIDDGGTLANGVTIA